MKTHILIAILSCAAFGAFAQGQVQFLNFFQGTGTTPLVDARVFFADGTTPLDNSNTGWRAALLGGPTNLRPANANPGHEGWYEMGTLPMLWNPTTTTLTWVNFQGAPNQGYVLSPPRSAAREVEGVDWGGTALIQMVAWQGNYVTWMDAFNAFNSGAVGVLIGTSNPLTLALPSSPNDPRLAYLVGLQSFSIQWVPEPGSFGLAIIGVAAVLMLRCPGLGKRAKPKDTLQVEVTRRGTE